MQHEKLGIRLKTAQDNLHHIDESHGHILDPTQPLLAPAGLNCSGT